MLETRKVNASAHTSDAKKILAIGLFGFLALIVSPVLIVLFMYAGELARIMAQAVIETIYATLTGT